MMAIDRVIKWLEQERRDGARFVAVDAPGQLVTIGDEDDGEAKDTLQEYQIGGVPLHDDGTVKADWDDDSPVGWEEG